MQQRQLGPFTVSSIGLGCMNLSHAYGTPPSPETAEALLLEALELGITHFDSAALYGFGANETLVGRVLKPYRSRITLASKCGMTGVPVDGGFRRVIDGRPQTLKLTCEASLKRLQTDVIDLYYLHRWDKQIPIEDSVGALADLVREGKIRSIGLSEVSANTLRKANAVHPIAALQTEYSIWARNAEIAVRDACKQLGIAFVAFSPIGRGFLADALPDQAALATLDGKDIRRGMPRFHPENFSANLVFLQRYRELAAEAGCTPAQLALAWLHTRGEHILPIPGTTQIAHLRENVAAVDVNPVCEVLQQLENLLASHTISGPRYNAMTQQEIDTEEFDTA